jgi:hypothetical protein
MVFDNFTLGSSLNSSNNEILDSYVDNNKLYVLQNSNIIIYDINADLASNINLTIQSNISLTTNDYFFIKESNVDITLYTKTLKNKLTINRDTNTYNITETNIPNVSNLNISKDGFYYDNTPYAIHNTGKSITNINTKVEHLISTNVTKFSSIKDNNIIHIRLNNIVYVIVSDQDCIFKWNIITKAPPIIIIISDYQIVKRKFSKAIYSNITNKIYLIPYNIIELIVIDVAKDTIEFIPLSGLTNLKTKAFFSTAVENQGYIYMIPNTLNFIYVFNIYENKIINIMDISSFNGILNESSKFIDAYMFTDSIRKRIFAVPNRSNKLGLIDYDLGVGAVLESTANFNILSSSLFNADIDGYYVLDNVLELGTNTFYESTYTRGTTNFTLYSENSSNIFEWRPKNAITITTDNFLSNIKTIDNIQYFQDDNNKNIFEIYKPPSTAIIYSSFEANDFLSNNRIITGSINNIYSIENNTVYFIPYNFKNLIALELNNDISQPPILKLLDITKNSDTNVTKFKSFMDNITGRFNCSIIVNQKLYMVPYIDSGDTQDTIIPFVIYDFVKNKTKTNIVNIVIKDLKTLLNTSSQTFIGTQLFCTILFYTSDNTQYLFLIHKNANFSIFYTISDSNEVINSINIRLNNSEYSDGCIIGDRIYLLDKDTANLYIYDIEIPDPQTVNFNYNKQIDLLNPVITDKYSKMLYYENTNTLYLIPYNANKIGRIRNIGGTDNFDEIPIENSGYSINEQLFKGGTLLTLNNKTYILMVPYESKKLYLYNITDPPNGSFTYIEDSIFKTNKFVDCTVDIKGNIYFNTYDGSILYYVLSIEKFYTIPRLPVLSKTEISFKDIYKKFHKDFIYDKYNYNNKQIKFSDYFNQGGVTYYTVANVEENKFIVDDTNLVSIVNSKTTPNITYTQFTSLQCNVQLNIQNYKKVKSQRYEYYDVYDGTKGYTIDSVNIAPNNTYIYYVKKYSNRIALYDENTLIDATITGNIGDYDITNINPTVLLTLPIDLNTLTIFDAMNNTNSIKDYTKVIATLKKGPPIANPLVFDTAYFIKHGITESTPKETMNILSTVEFDIKGTINKGLTINIDGLDRSYTDMDTYLRALNIIDIKISTTGIINYADNTKSLIILTNPRDLLRPLAVNIYEEISKTELYSSLTGNTNTALTDLKINKLTLVISSNTPITINIDLYTNLIYLKEIIVLINVTYTSTLTFTRTANHRHNLNIIVYDNA